VTASPARYTARVVPVASLYDQSAALLQLRAVQINLIRPRRNCRTRCTAAHTGFCDHDMTLSSCHSDHYASKTSSFRLELGICAIAMPKAFSDAKTSANPLLYSFTSEPAPRRAASSNNPLYRAWSSCYASHYTPRPTRDIRVAAVDLHVRVIQLLATRDHLAIEIEVMALTIHTPSTVQLFRVPLRFDAITWERKE
jgi:hypothetical protein